MAFNKAPSSWITAGYGSSTSAHTITFATAGSTSASLPQLSDANADPTTGDIRFVYFALTDKLFQVWAAKAQADLSKKMVITRTTSNNPDGTLNYQYHLKFIVNPPSGVYSIPSE